VTPVRGDTANLDDLDLLYATMKTAAKRLDIFFASAGGGTFRHPRATHARRVRPDIQQQRSRHSLHCPESATSAE
jgi:hypothetical protein